MELQETTTQAKLQGQRDKLTFAWDVLIRVSATGRRIKKQQQRQRKCEETRNTLGLGVRAERGAQQRQNEPFSGTARGLTAASQPPAGAVDERRLQVEREEVSAKLRGGRGGGSATRASRRARGLSSLLGPAPPCAQDGRGREGLP